MKHKHTNNDPSSVTLPVMLILVVFAAIVILVAITFQQHKLEIQYSLEDSINTIAASTQSTTIETVQPTPTELSEPSQTVSVSTPATISSPVPTENLPAANKIYKKYLLQLLNDNLLPDGTSVELFGNSISDNQFAIYDVDGDGEEELILQITATYSAAMTEAVYSFDSESNDLFSTTELSVYPSVTYYDNGYILGGWSHGNGKEPEGFWPFEIYQYNEETDCYDNIGEVFSDNIYGDCFLFRMGEEWTSGNTEFYNSWMKDLLNSGNVIEIPYKEISADNIDDIVG